MRYPLCGSAFPDTSGVPRPPMTMGGTGVWTYFCHGGVAKNSLTPPPEPPHAISPVILPLAPRTNVVPPQATTYGLELGKSTWSPSLLAASVDPSSPDAAKTVI